MQHAAIAGVMAGWGPSHSLRLGFSVLALAACTLIYSEGNSNSVSDIEGHTGALKVPPQPLWHSHSDS